MSEELKAFVVTTDYAEASVLVWETTPSKAKHEAMGSLWLDGCEWTDLKCRREPRADAHTTERGRMTDGPTTDDCRLMRNLGWYEVDGNSQPCSECERYQWDSVLESTMSETSDLCAECAAAKIDPLKKIEKERRAG